MVIIVDFFSVVVVVFLSSLVAVCIIYETGVVYIKFSKTSEAAKALEEMNGKTLGTPPGSRPLKVLVASR